MVKATPTADKVVAEAVEAASKGDKIVAKYEFTVEEAVVKIASRMDEVMMEAPSPLVREELTPWVEDSGVDLSGLGHWPWCLLEGNKGVDADVDVDVTMSGLVPFLLCP